LTGKDNWPAIAGYRRNMPRRSNGSLRRDGSGEPRGKSPDGPSATLGGRSTQQTRYGDFYVRSVPGAAARKTYRCPGCQQLLQVGTAHLVVWPAEDLSWLQSAVDSRRHWHSSCWHRHATRGGPGAID
jgi:hypothetical protein